MVRSKHRYPPKQGLYSPEFEKEACGVGFVAKINGEKSHQVLSEALTVLERMKHRGACGYEENCGDGAGVMTGIPHAFCQRVIQKCVETRKENLYFDIRDNMKGLTKDSDAVA